MPIHQPATTAAASLRSGLDEVRRVARTAAKAFRSSSASASLKGVKPGDQKPNTVGAADRTEPFAEADMSYQRRCAMPSQSKLVLYTSPAPQEMQKGRKGAKPKTLNP